MNAGRHDRIEELLAARALDALEPAEVVELDELRAGHGACDECLRLEAELNDAAAMLAFSLTPEAVDPAMADRVLHADRVGGDPGPARIDEVAVRRERKGRRGWVAAAGIAAALALVLVSYAALRPSTEVTATNWAQEVVTFDGAEGEFAMAFVPGEPGVAFWGEDLPALEEGEVFEIWMFEGETPVRGGCVEPVDGQVAAFLDADVSSADAMAVTVEGDACPEAPTTDPVFIAPLVA